MKNTALLVMDMQSSIVSTLPDTEELVSKLKGAIKAAKNHQIPVIYITVNFRQAMPEISSNNKAFSATKTRMADIDMKEWARIHPELNPEEHDIVIAKKDSVLLQEVTLKLFCAGWAFNIWY